jgi:hypothetical protein
MEKYIYKAFINPFTSVLNIGKCEVLKMGENRLTIRPIKPYFQEEKVSKNKSFFNLKNALQECIETAERRIENHKKRNIRCDGLKKGLKYTRKRIEDL